MVTNKIFFGFRWRSEFMDIDILKILIIVWFLWKLKMSCLDQWAPLQFGSWALIYSQWSLMVLLLSGKKRCSTRILCIFYHKVGINHFWGSVLILSSVGIGVWRTQVGPLLESLILCYIFQWNSGARKSPTPPNTYVSVGLAFGHKTHHRFLLVFPTQSQDQRVFLTSPILNKH